MTTAEIIYELVKTMPEEQAHLVLKLAETLQKRQMEKPLEPENLALLNQDMNCPQNPLKAR